MWYLVYINQPQKTALGVYFLTSCFGLMTYSAVGDSALVDAALRKSALYQMDVPALSNIYAAYGKSGLISNGKE